MRSSDKPSKNIRRLLPLALIAVLILGIFVVIISIYLVMNPGGRSNQTIGQTTTSNVYVVPPGSGRTPPKGIPYLPETSQDGDQHLASLISTVKSLSTDEKTSGWIATNPSWRLMDANTWAMNHDGLAYRWDVVLQGNNSIMRATVIDGTVQAVDVQNIDAVQAVNDTNLDTIWDSTWVLYNTTSTNNLSSHYADQLFSVEYYDNDSSPEYHVSCTNSAMPRYSFDIKVNATTGEITQGEVWPYD